MKQPNVFLKAAAVTSSLLLTSALVLYRGGAVNWFAQPAAPARVAAVRTAAVLPLRPERADTPEVATPDSVRRRQTSAQRGSRGASSTGTGDRSGGTRDTVQFRQSGELRSDPTFMTGSKSMVPLVAFPQSGTATAAHPDSSPRTRRADREPVFMGSSKSLAPLIEPAAVASPDTSRRDTSTPSKHIP
ncbi:MAG TPA: hypothetical protein VHI13_04155 [Candidatus Kapabacteria bacterium]|nr:hypothetical protein [Candidatus Kapabacteria bacterium]